MAVTKGRALEIVAEEFARLNPPAVFVGFDAAKSRWASTRWTRVAGGPWGTAQINLSYDALLFEDESDLRDAVRHECAHAFVGPDKGHGPAWKAAAVRCGANPKRTTDGKNDLGWRRFKWSAYCPSCNKVVAGRHRLTDALTRSARYHPPCRTARLAVRWVETARLADEALS